MAYVASYEENGQTILSHQLDTMNNFLLNREINGTRHKTNLGLAKLFLKNGNIRLANQALITWISELPPHHQEKDDNLWKFANLAQRQLAFREHQGMTESQLHYCLIGLDHLMQQEQ